MEAFLLRGEAPHSSIPGKKSILPFTWQKQFNGCLADPANWIPLWESLKDELLPQWRKEHGKELCYSEKELLKINGN